MNLLTPVHPEDMAAVRAWFDKLAAGKGPKAVGEKIGQAAGEQMAKAFEYRNNPALERGSREEYSARVRWQQESKDGQLKQLEQQRMTAKNTAAAVEQLKVIAAKLAPSALKLGVI